MAPLSLNSKWLPLPPRSVLKMSNGNGKGQLCKLENNCASNIALCTTDASPLINTKNHIKYLFLRVTSYEETYSVNETNVVCLYLPLLLLFNREKMSESMAPGKWFSIFMTATYLWSTMCLKKHLHLAFSPVKVKWHICKITGL